jgi:putative phosphoesterase
MKVLIVSDTHGRNQNYLRTLEKVAPIDMLIHLGDLQGGEEYIESVTGCRIEMVSGNNDFFNGYPKENIIQIGKYTVMLTHGHRYGVNYSTYDIKEAAKRNKADIVMFGHTHVPMIDLSDSVWLINPGSLTLPRQNGRIPTFIIMEIDPKGDAHFTLNYLKDNE